MRVKTDTYRFNCVWKGRWYRLGSLSDHHINKMDPAGPNYLLLDELSRKFIAPKKEVAIADY